jgi:hypothetical protein
MKEMREIGKGFALYSKVFCDEFCTTQQENAVRFEIFDQNRSRNFL